MAKYKPSPLFEKLKGSIRDLVFIEGKYGSQIRTKAVPRNKITPPRIRVRRNHGKTSDAWAKVNPQQVNAWRAFAMRFPYINDVDQEVYYTNRSIFLKCNRSLIEINQPVILDPPKNTNVQNFDTIDADIIVSGDLWDIKLHFKPLIKKNTKVIVFATAFLKPGVNSPKSNKYKEIAVLDSTFINGSSILEYYNKVFLYQSFKSFKIAFKFKPVSTLSGFRSPEIQLIESPQIYNPKPTTDSQLPTAL